jgi:membrane-associated phospholipid phosphatase
MNDALSIIGFNGPANLFYGTFILMCFGIFRGFKNYSILDLCYVFIWQYPHSRLFGINGDFNGINYYFNGVLKNLFEKSRPKNMKFIHPSDAKNGKEFGMPSGHAQLASSMVMFLILEFNNPYISIISIIQLFLTLKQRYIYGMHTISQLIAGSLIGCLSGWFFYILFTKYKPNYRLL